MVIELYTADQLVPHGELFRAVQAGTIDAAQSDDDFDGGSGRRRRVRRLLPVRLALQPGRAGAVALVRPEGDLGGSVWRGGRRHLAEHRRLGPLQLRDHEADPIARGSRRGCACTCSRPAAGSCSSSASSRSRCPTRTSRSRSRPASSTASAGRGITEDYTVGWADVTKYYLTNPISGAWAGSYFANTRPVERAARAPEDIVPAVDGQLALLPAALVLVGRSAVPHQGRQAGADHDPRGRSGRPSSRRRSRSGTRSRSRARATPRWSRSSRTTRRPCRRRARPTATHEIGGAGSRAERSTAAAGCRAERPQRRGARPGGRASMPPSQSRRRGRRSRCEGAGRRARRHLRSRSARARGRPRGCGSGPGAGPVRARDNASGSGSCR